MCSSETFVSTCTRERASTLVASSRPPRPASTTAHATPAAANATNAAAVERLELGHVGADRLAHAQHRRLVGRRRRSRRRRCGCARETTSGAARGRRRCRCPAAGSSASAKSVVEPLPFVPTTWIASNARSGLPSRSSSAVHALEAEAHPEELQRVDVGVGARSPHELPQPRLQLVAPRPRSAPPSPAPPRPAPAGALAGEAARLRASPRARSSSARALGELLLEPRPHDGRILGRGLDHDGGDRRPRPPRSRAAPARARAPPPGTRAAAPAARRASSAPPRRPRWRPARRPRRAGSRCSATGCRERLEHQQAALAGQVRPHRLGHERAHRMRQEQDPLERPEQVGRHVAPRVGVAALQARLGRLDVPVAEVEHERVQRPSPPPRTRSASISRTTSLERRGQARAHPAVGRLVAGRRRARPTCRPA